MNGLRLVPPARLVLVLCSAFGVLVGLATVTTAGAIVTARGDEPSGPRLVATHMPPLLTVPGAPVRLVYEAFCLGGDAPGDASCDVSGTVFVRTSPKQDFAGIELEPVTSVEGRSLVADVPELVAAAADGFEYYAVLAESSGHASLTVPSGGSAAPHRSKRLDGAVEVDLGRHAFGHTRQPDERVASAAWGIGPNEVGLEGGRTLSPIGASAFAVDRSGAVYVLDQVKRRVLRWHEMAKVPARIPVSVSGTLADMAVAPDGSIYVLETAGSASATPLVRRFDSAGRELERAGTAEATVSQIRMGADGPVVLQQPSHQWMPMTSIDGSLASSQAQRRNGGVGRPLPSGGEVVVLRTGSEIRIALTGRGDARRSWRLHSGTALGEVQLAQPVGDRLLLVVRAYTENEAEFVALILGQRGLADRMSLATADWAETAPLGRFELVGSSLYRLGSSPRGAFVDRFDLEVG
jgi:hypothetical protein